MSNIKIHPQAIVSDQAKLHPSVQVGPWSWIGPEVEIAENCVIGPHVIIKGPTKIGANNRFYQFSSIGEDCQDLKYAGERTFLEIGAGNIFREYVSVHRGTAQDHALTKIGDYNLFITGSHVAHDCVIGNHCIIGHHVGLAGHVHVDDYAILGGYVAVHQFCRIGTHTFLGGNVALVKDLPPYMLAALDGGDTRVISINAVGLRRRGLTEEDILMLKRAYKVLYRQDLTIDAAVAELQVLAKKNSHIQPLIDFVNQATRGILR
ncbi:MAG: acyl-ACP--UDP-N-acetylglucosamine O-acyltransferase [Pseudomonadota bacterium]